MDLRRPFDMLKGSSYNRQTSVGPPWGDCTSGCGWWDNVDASRSTGQEAFIAPTFRRGVDTKMRVGAVKSIRPHFYLRWHISELSSPTDFYMSQVTVLGGFKHVYHDIAPSRLGLVSQPVRVGSIISRDGWYPLPSSKATPKPKPP